MASLIVRDGPMRGRRIEVGFDEFSLGREKTDLVIEDDTEISRAHAVVRPVDGGVEIEDLDSTNGTFVNELKISGPTRLSNGDIIRVGQTRLDVAVEEDPDATRVSSIVIPPTSPTDLPIPVQRHVSSEPEPEGASDAEVDDSEMRAPTSELPSRQKVGGGAIQRAGAKRGVLVALAVVLALVAGYFLYSLIAGGAPSKEEYVASVNDICEPEVSKLNNLRNVNRTRSVEQGSRLVNGMLAEIQELERPEGSDQQIGAFLSSFEKVGSTLERLSVSLQANNDKRARKPARRLEFWVVRSDAAAKRLGANECALRN